MYLGRKEIRAIDDGDWIYSSKFKYWHLKKYNRLKYLRLMRQTVKRAFKVIADTQKYVHRSKVTRDDVTVIITCIRCLYILREYLMFWGVLSRMGVTGRMDGIGAITEALGTMNGKTTTGLCNYMTDEFPKILGRVKAECRLIGQEFQEEKMPAFMSRLNHMQLLRARRMPTIDGYLTIKHPYEIPQLLGHRGYRRNGENITEVTDTDYSYRVSRIADNLITELYNRLREACNARIEASSIMDVWEGHVKLINESIDMTFDAAINREHEYDKQTREREKPRRRTRRKGGDGGDVHGDKTDERKAS